MKNLRDLARELCRREGKKKQVNIAQMSEIIKCLRCMIRENPIEVLSLLINKS